MSFVRTVLGDIQPEQMGLTYSHEHIIIEESFPTLANPEFVLNDTERIAAELREVYENGGRTMVDTMPAACGRNILKLAEVSRKSNINIIAPTGIHLEIYYPPNHWRFHLSANELTELFIADIVQGVDEYDYCSPVVKRTPHKAGMIKLATGDDKITDHQRKIFEAVVNAHLETGVPILTHTNGGKLAIDQVELFLKLGADPNHIVISHVDKCKDLSYHKDLMQTGVYVEYDSHFRWKTPDENWTMTLLEHLLPDFADQIVIGMDMAKHSYWKSYGGKPGLTYLLKEFRQELDKRNLEGYFEKMFIANPQKLYSFKELLK
ncbi:MAG TPA: aryldialkylphosphatase [Prolixibacteraceae bacterium]|nr:aryldialkylphosphatase [Prolixibacteraceae bacterium]